MHYKIFTKKSRFRKTPFYQSGEFLSYRNGLFLLPLGYSLTDTCLGSFLRGSRELSDLFKLGNYSARNAATVVIRMPAVFDASFMKGPKCFISPVSRCVAPQRRAVKKIGRSLAARSMGQSWLEMDGRTVMSRRIIPRRDTAEGNLDVRLRLASSTAKVEVNILQCPSFPSFITSAAFPDGLCAAVKRTLASRKRSFTVCL